MIHSHNRVVHHTLANEPIKYLPTKPLPHIRRWLLSTYNITLYRYAISKKYTYTPNVKFAFCTFVQLYSIVSAFGIHMTSHINNIFIGTYFNSVHYSTYTTYVYYIYISVIVFQRPYTRKCIIYSQQYLLNLIFDENL